MKWLLLGRMQYRTIYDWSTTEVQKVRSKAEGQRLLAFLNEGLTADDYHYVILMVCKTKKEAMQYICKDEKEPMKKLKVKQLVFFRNNIMKDWIDPIVKIEITERKIEVYNGYGQYIYYRADNGFWREQGTIHEEYDRYEIIEIDYEEEQPK